MSSNLELIKQYTKKSVMNSSLVPISSGKSFIGQGELNEILPSLAVSVETDRNGTLKIEFSLDGENWNTSLVFIYDTTRINPPHVLEHLGRYIRVIFENTSGSNQTYFRLHTCFGLFNKLTSPINGILPESADALVTRPTSYQHEIAMGKRQGHTNIQLWGSNESLALNTEEIIAPWSAAFNPVTDIMTVAGSFTINYTNTVDGAGQTGARSILVEYLDANFNLASAVHILGSTGTDVTSFTGLGINRAYVLSNGGLGWNAQNIDFLSPTGAYQCRIESLKSVSQQLMFHTPINHTLLLDWFYKNLLKTTAGLEPRIDIRGYSWSRVTLTRYEVYHQITDTAVENTVNLPISQPFIIGGREVLYFTAKADKDVSTAEMRAAGILKRIT